MMDLTRRGHGPGAKGRGGYAVRRCFAHGRVPGVTADRQRRSRIRLRRARAGPATGNLITRRGHADRLGRRRHRRWRPRHRHCRQGRGRHELRRRKAQRVRRAWPAQRRCRGQLYLSGQCGRARMSATASPTRSRIISGATDTARADRRDRQDAGRHQGRCPADRSGTGRRRHAAAGRRAQRHPGGRPQPGRRTCPTARS